jgi:hypothetical protein
MNSINRTAQPPDKDWLEQIEEQLREITTNLEQLGLNALQHERLIALTFLDISQELTQGR